MFQRIQFQSLPATDVTRAMEFYRDILGMPVQTDHPMPDGGRWVFMQMGNSETLLHLGHFAMKPDAQGTVPMLALTSDDVDAEAEKMKSAGVELVDDARAAPWNEHVRYATFRDCEGNLVMMQSSSKES
ncbi:MAG: VOC family protein [Pseudomonadota bacterium]